MPLPVNVSVCTITGKFVDADGSASVGTVAFIPTPQILLDATATPPTSILPAPVVATLNASGEIPAAFTIPATDDVDLNPVGWTYRVVINTTYYRPEPFFMNAPGGATIDLTTVLPAIEFAGVESVFVGSETFVADVEAHIADTTSAHGGKVAKAGDTMSGALAWPAGANILGDAEFGTLDIKTGAAGSINFYTQDSPVLRLAVEDSRVRAYIPVLLPGAPTENNHAATKAYVDGLSGVVTDGDKGDVVVSGGGATWTVESATDTIAGKVELATNAETTTGVDTSRATTAAGVKAAIDAAIAALINSAPGALDTLDELANALGDDPNFATTVTNALAGKVAKTGDSMSGALTWTGSGSISNSGGELRVNNTAGSIVVQTNSVNRLAIETARILASLPIDINSVATTARLSVSDGVLTIETDGGTTKKIILEVANVTKLDVAETLTTSANPIALPADPTTNLQAATKQYVDKRAINAQTGTTYTLVQADAGKLVTLSNAGAITLTAPTLAAGTVIDLAQLGAGAVTVVASGITLNATPSAIFRAQYSGAAIVYLTSTLALLVGDLA